MIALLTLLRRINSIAALGIAVALAATKSIGFGVLFAIVFFVAAVILQGAVEVLITGAAPYEKIYDSDIERSYTARDLIVHGSTVSLLIALNVALAFTCFSTI